MYGLLWLGPFFSSFGQLELKGGIFRCICYPYFKAFIDEANLFTDLQRELYIFSGRWR